VPRLINTLCDTAMMAAFTADRGVVTRTDIASAVAELQWQEYATRTQQYAGDAGGALGRPAQPRGGPPSLGHLLVASEGRTVQEVPLRLGRLIVGRTPDNDVQIDSRFISRHHCQVITTAHSCVIEDLNSTNGIYVKSNRVRRHYLNDGDVVLVGKHELIYVDERAARVRGTFTETVPGLHKSMDGPVPVRSASAASNEDEELDEDAEASPPG
jgi:pSer/pThr/pTyr-binding forkhead associated (FHA) protein